MLKTLVFIPLLCGHLLLAQKNNFDSVISQMKYAAKELLIDKYYPLVVDTTYGGYLSTLSFDMKQTGAQDKTLVIESRHLWSTSKAASFYHDTAFVNMARHGFKFLQNKLWDKEHGGFYNGADQEGRIKTNKKDAFSNSYAIFALAAYYKCSHDAEALELAKKAFAWLEAHAHDKNFKGYYSALSEDGKPVERTAAATSASDVGYKDQNTTVHLLEAFTELYTTWPDALLKQRLGELLDLTVDKLVHPKGYIQFYFTPDWKPVSFKDSSETVIRKHLNLDHISFGHDVETAYLLLDASKALNKYRYAQVLSLAKKLTDHALNNGWDKEIGGFYDEGYYFNAAKPAITRTTKSWWPQAEGLNTLLIMAHLFPSDKMNYLQQYLLLWKYTQNNLIDYTYGDWYATGLDTDPAKKTALKANIWKGTYHVFRALSNCIVSMQQKD